MMARLGCAVLMFGLVQAATGAPVRFSDMDPIVLNGGFDTAWQITNRFSTSNGLPTGGDGTASGQGLGIVDASIGTNPVRGDAFDGGNLVFVDGVQFVAPDTVDVANGALTAGPVVLSELNVTVEYRAIASSQFLRTVVTVENPTTTARRPDIQLATNVGSDGATRVRTALGQDPFTRILVTSDGEPLSDALNVFAFFGGFRPAVLPLVTHTAFAVAGTQGEVARYEPWVQPGDTIRLMVVNGLAFSTTDGDFLFDFLAAGNPQVGDGLMVGLSAVDTLRIVNWDYFGGFELGGGGATWQFADQAGTSNGAAVGGRCTSTRAFGLRSAVIDGGPFPEDAFDGGLAVFVGGETVRTPKVTKSGRSLITDPQPLGDLSVSLEHTALFDSPTLRTRILLANPDPTEVVTTVQIASNFGSGTDTTVRAANDGGTAIGAALRWVVTSSPVIFEDSDPVITSVVEGPGQPAVAATTSPTVFECSSTDGLLASYDVRIPGGATRALLLFNELHREVVDATATAPRFDTTPPLGDPLVANLDEGALLQIINWDFCAALPASFPTVGCSLDGLDAGVQRALTPGKLLARLTTALGTARGAVTKADTLRTKGKRGPARKQLAKATATVKSLARRLGSKAYTAVLDPDTRDTLVARTNALATRIGTVRNAL
jgi:hypothetical protein